MRASLPLLFVMAAGAGPLAAQPPAASPPPAAACPAEPAPLPAELAAFRTPVSATAGDGAAKSAMPVLTPGRAAALSLVAMKTLALPTPLSRNIPPEGFGGLAELAITDAGTYRIALGAGAWIEVVGGGTLLKSVAHSHGPACSGVRKIVDFALKPGRYVIELAGSRDPAVTVLAVRLP